MFCLDILLFSRDFWREGGVIVSMFHRGNENGKERIE